MDDEPLLNPSEGKLKEGFDVAVECGEQFPDGNVRAKDSDSGYDSGHGSVPSERPFASRAGSNTTSVVSQGQDEGIGGEDIYESEIGALALEWPLVDRMRYMGANATGMDHDQIISDLSHLYLVSRSVCIRDTVIAYSTHAAIPINHRMILCTLLIDTDDPMAYHVLCKNAFCSEFKTLTATEKVHYIFILMSTPRYCADGFSLFKSIVVQCYAIDYVYSSFLKIEGIVKRTDSPSHLEMLFKQRVELCDALLDISSGNTRYTILIAQYLISLTKSKSQEDEGVYGGRVSKAVERLVCITEQVELDEATRADAADTLIGCKIARYVDVGMECIKMLSGSGQTVFENKQNVHTIYIPDTIDGLLKKLPLRVSSGLTVEKVGRRLATEYTPVDKGELLQMSLKRIVLDRAIYSNYTLKNILLRVWVKIENDESFTQEQQVQMKLRLSEELVESAMLCSSGYVARMLNVFSGFDESMSYSISFKDQIIANVKARMSCLIRNDPFCDVLLEEMMLPSSCPEKRQGFLKFFKSNFGLVSTELYMEFKPYISDNEFDEYMCDAVRVFNGCNY